MSWTFFFRSKERVDLRDSHFFCVSYQLLLCDKPGHVIVSYCVIIAAALRHPIFIIFFFYFIRLFITIHWHLLPSCHKIVRFDMSHFIFFFSNLFLVFISLLLDVKKKKIRNLIALLKPVGVLLLFLFSLFISFLL